VNVLRSAAVFARSFDAALVCANVNASRYTAAFDSDGAVILLPLVPDQTDGYREQFDTDLAQTIETTLNGTGVAWCTQALAGVPARELELLAERVDAQMIIVSAREPGARDTIREFFNGSVAAELVYHRQRPVVIVPLNRPAATGSFLGSPATGWAAR
jgi:nucleotide-binding universal stress UspA family protein